MAMIYFSFSKIPQFASCAIEFSTTASRNANDICIEEVKCHKHIAFDGYYCGGIVRVQPCSCKFETLLIV